MKTTKITVVAAFCLLLALSSALIFFTDKSVLTLDFFNTSGEYLTGNPDTEIIAYHQLQSWIYISEAVYLSVKILIVSIIIYSALYLSNQACTFSAVVMVVIRCEFVFLLAALIKVLAFISLYHPGTLTDWHRFHPLSLLSLFDNVGASWYYLLQVLNIFELGYWFLLAFFIVRLTQNSFDHSLRLVMISYVPALLIWVLTVSFVSVIIFPGQI
jgi:hypothetical protein